MTNQPALIEARDVTVTSGRQTLLAPVTFSLTAGQTACVTGPNGSGKTTLMRLLTGLRATAGGVVLVDGIVPDLRQARFRRTVSRLISPVPFSFRLTVGEHLRLVAMTWGLVPGEADRRVAEWLERLEASDLAGRFPHQMSAGELQAASLCVALVRPFGLLVLDEPEQSLDVSRVDALAEVLKAVAQDGAAVIAATHSTALTRALGGPFLELGRPPK
ncbi:MAG: ATP-binding cassette domain-containing protein [Bifidobacteriaceae bacterium]|jgi:ABC-type multidrug transport system ATPase subunit|nr:ATP-binding cassette domain-containing protein [Bifidobacteriaceae bacterium]